MSSKPKTHNPSSRARPTTGQGLKPENGFTLVEILIAIFLFSLAITATTFILLTNNKSAIAIRNNFIASGLAQEGIEVVRNLRDQDWFSGNPFGASLPDGTHRVQWDSQALIVGGDFYLKKDSITG